MLKRAMFLHKYVPGCDSAYTYFRCWPELKSNIQSPTLFLVVKDLPKGAAVEKQVIIHTGRCEVIDDYDGEAMIENKRPVYHDGQSTSARVSQ